MRLVLLVLLASCEGGRSGPDAAPDAVAREVVCERAGTSTVTGTGPYGPLDGAHVYVGVLSGFCGTTLEITITHDDPLQRPQRVDNARSFVWAPGLGEMPTEWSGTFNVTLESPDETNPADGTLAIERGTRLGVMPSFVRGTLQTTGTWQLDATFDVPYCQVITCL